MATFSVLTVCSLYIMQSVWSIYNFFFFFFFLASHLFQLRGAGNPAGADAALWTALGNSRTMISHLTSLHKSFLL